MLLESTKIIASMSFNQCSTTPLHRIYPMGVIETLPNAMLFEEIQTLIRSDNGPGLIDRTLLQ
jgi:hypothetical protein